MGYHGPVLHRLNKILEKINTDGAVRYNEPMSRHTTFEIGGPADLFLEPVGIEPLVETLRVLQEYEVPVFILGGGANILVSDLGIRGAVVHTGRLVETRYNRNEVEIGAGRAISEAAREVSSRGLGGLHFLYGMPGSVGGAVWMNARCYGSQVDDVLIEVEYLDSSLKLRRYKVKPEQFGYKISPFQETRDVILSARFSLTPADRELLIEQMEHNKSDRKNKGHYTAPCAGSVFKNNREFGAPTGVLIDRTGLRGTRIGNAEISRYHANIFVNPGGARASDMLQLIRIAENEVQKQFGFRIEREIQLIGDWSESGTDLVQDRPATADKPHRPSRYDGASGAR